MRTHSIRWGTALIAVGAILAACGGGDDDTSVADSVVDTTDAPADAETDEVSDGADASDDTGDDASGDEADDADPEADGADDGGDTIVVRSIDDIPEACRDLMADFLREIEPVVEPIDWTAASFNDFETIAEEFETLASEFDDATADAPECDALELDDDDDFTLLIDFSEDVAPGTTPFLQFLSDLADGADADISGESATSFDDCDGARAFVEDLMSRYDSLQDVPVTELTALMSLGTVLTTCDPDGLAFFESEAVQEFIAG